MVQTKMETFSRVALGPSYNGFTSNEHMHASKFFCTKIIYSLCVRPSVNPFVLSMNETEESIF